MRIALIGSPLIEVPPRRYGGTELFIANLACELYARGHDVTVYGNGESSLPCPVRWKYDRSLWPPSDDARPQLRTADHTAWALENAAREADVIHLNDAAGVAMTRFVDVPIVLTIHHPSDPILSEHYACYPRVHYVAIAEWLAHREPMPHVSVVHHGLPIADYTFSSEKDDYLLFLGRMAPCKGPHVAIDVARKAGLPLKLAGEVQPLFRDYWERQVLPGIDGRVIDYVGEADFRTKNELLSRARALLFPIQWEEPFGLVMIEAMACGTPVLAFRGGAVEEVVSDGVNGWICRDADDMAARAASAPLAPAACRNSVQTRFSVEKMADGYLDVYSRTIAAHHGRRPDRRTEWMM